VGGGRKDVWKKGGGGERAPCRNINSTWVTNKKGGERATPNSDRCNVKGGARLMVVSGRSRKRRFRKEILGNR